MGMLAHWRLKHASLSMPDALKQQLSISSQEHDAVLKMGKAPPKQRKKRSAPSAPAADASAPAEVCSECSDEGGGGTPLQSEAEDMAV